MTGFLVFDRHLHRALSPTAQPGISGRRILGHLLRDPATTSNGNVILVEPLHWRPGLATREPFDRLGRHGVPLGLTLSTQREIRDPTITVEHLTTRWRRAGIEFLEWRGHRDGIPDERLVGIRQLAAAAAASVAAGFTPMVTVAPRLRDVHDARRATIDALLRLGHEFADADVDTSALWLRLRPVHAPQGPPSSKGIVDNTIAVLRRCVDWPVAGVALTAGNESFERALSITAAVAAGARALGVPLTIVDGFSRAYAGVARDVEDPFSARVAADAIAAARGQASATLASSVCA